MAWCLPNDWCSVCEGDGDALALAEFVSLYLWEGADLAVYQLIGNRGLFTEIWAENILVGIPDIEVRKTVMAP